ncbi:MAG TPA: NAD(+)/NADH kinase [Streptosporangiaceae bacterium]|jgi:NAD+ kinase|nr:NAD(+)/NADH kinase [Streptosporangiaceae bacterium]
MGQITEVGLVLHPGRDSKEAMETITSWARERGKRILALKGEAERVAGNVEAVTPDVMAERADLVVSMGGDGTMLRALRLACGARAPVLGVNVGKLGFLAEVDPPELGDALRAIDEGRFTVERRSGLIAEIGGEQTIAFNDVDLVRIPGTGSTAVLELTVQDHPFVRYAADAVIVATPTGSTAYSFSAGGPIVSPSAEGLLVTPVSPHSAFNRALFLSGGEDVALTVLPSSAELAVEADGRVVGHASAGARLEAKLLPGAAKVVRLGKTTFYQRAQRRLRLTGSAEAD